MISKNHLPYVIIVGLLLITVGAVASAVYYSRQYQKSEEAIKNPKQAADDEIAKLVKKVGTLMILPSGTPTVATVSDVSALAGQPFFANAQNGDQVLVYTDAKKAILYRPGQNIIVEVAPVIMNNPASATSSSGLLSNVEAQMRIAIRNGTNIVGVAKALEDELKAKMKNVVITEKDNTKARGVEKTTVVDLTGRESEVASQLATSIGAEVGFLPQGEPKPNADFLIIIGMDRK